jgi:hypothetical protein
LTSVVPLLLHAAVSRHVVAAVQSSALFRIFFIIVSSAFDETVTNMRRTVSVRVYNAEGAPPFPPHST